MRPAALLTHLKQHHYGCGRAVSSGVLEAAFCVTGREIRTAVNTLRSMGEPVCSDENGYYCAANEQELQHSIRQLDSRIRKIAKAKNGLNTALVTHFLTETEGRTYGG